MSSVQVKPVRRSKRLIEATEIKTDNKTTDIQKEINFDLLNMNTLQKLCKDKKIHNYSGKKKNELIDLIKDYQRCENITSSVKIPDWYLISQIQFLQFILNIKLIYDILEDKKVYNSEEDIFSIECQANYENISIEEVREKRKIIQKERTLTMAWGDFHQNIIGCITGLKSLGKGHKTGCDIATEIESWFWEMKNNINTMNSSSRESVINKLKKINESGASKAGIIIINGNTKKHQDKDGIYWISGEDFYAEHTGVENFMKGYLLETTNYCFKNFKTFDALIESLKTS